MTAEAGFEVLRLPPYHCNFNDIEIVWSEIKRKVRHDNVFTSEPAKVMDLIRNTCKQITPQK